MGEDVTTLSQVSAIPQSATAPTHVGVTPKSSSYRASEAATYYSQGVETSLYDTRQQGMQTYDESQLHSARDISDNWAYTSHTPRSASPRGKSPSNKTPRGKSPRAKTPQGTITTVKSALASGNGSKGKGKKVQIKEDKASSKSKKRAK